MGGDKGRQAPELLPVMRFPYDATGPSLPHESLLAVERPPPPSIPAALPLSRIAVKSVNRIVIVPVASIIRLEAEDNYVRLWADRPYLHKETLTGLMARLDPREFLRVHRSHAVNVRCVRELRPLLHGEYEIALADGHELCSGSTVTRRGCREPSRVSVRDLACAATRFARRERVSSVVFRDSSRAP